MEVESYIAKWLTKLEHSYVAVIMRFVTAYPLAHA